MDEDNQEQDQEHKPDYRDALRMMLQATADVRDRLKFDSEAAHQDWQIKHSAYLTMQYHHERLEAIVKSVEAGRAREGWA